MLFTKLLASKGWIFMVVTVVSSNRKCTILTENWTIVHSGVERSYHKGLTEKEKVCFIFILSKYSNRCVIQ